MSEDEFVNSVKNQGIDMKISLQRYFNVNEFTDSPADLLSIDSPYLDIEGIPNHISKK
jgi:hypothetical protein